MIALSLSVDKADIAAFQRQMMRLQTELKMTPKDATRVGTLAALKSLQPSTRKAKKTRPVRTSKSSRTRRVDGKRIFYAEKATDSGVKNLPIFAASLADAKKSPLAKIKFAGVAWASWGWAMQRLFNKGDPRVNFSAPSRKFLETSEKGRGQDYGIDIENTLDYISKAMQGGRGPAVATAMARASRAMKGRIDQRLKGHLK